MNARLLISLLIAAAAVGAPLAESSDQQGAGAIKGRLEIRRIANVNGAITDGAQDGWLHGPVEHWVEELGRLTRELRFDGFVMWPDHDDVIGQTERFAGEVAPAVRALAKQRSSRD